MLCSRVAQTAFQFSAHCL
ncbi:hypothetical protein RDI58_013511 [Solanum bulbocastanum]|uniref:Uncharacterized protein n=1 Tax=Solanum bulbocastanum TaxID=147425 RepID=A0AAN8TTS2_SOLBU